MEVAALQKDRDLDQCKVCTYSIYHSVYTKWVYRTYCIFQTKVIYVFVMQSDCMHVVLGCRYYQNSPTKVYMYT